MNTHPGDLLSAWLDGELDPADAAAVAAHVEGCPACAAERDEVSSARAAVRGLPSLAPPPGVLRPLPALHVGDLLSAWLDGEIEAEWLPGIEAHVSACPACTAEQEEVAWSRAALRGLPPVDPPEGVLRLAPAWPPPRVARPPVRRLRPRQLVAASAAVAAAAAGVLGLVGRSTPTNANQPSVASFVAQHSTSSPGPDPVSGLAPAAVPVSFTR